MQTEDLLIKRTQDSQKKYLFQNDANPRIISEYWFQSTPEGKTLFLVFYTQACRYSKCLGCNLPSKMSQHHIGFSDIMSQVDSVFNFYISNIEKQEICKIIVSNNGSVLDEDTFSTTALMYLIAKINLMCPNVSVVALESRPEYVDMEELEVLSRALYEGSTPSSLEIVIGFEAYDENIRNNHFRKGLNLSTFENLAQKISITNERFLKKYPDEFMPMKIKAYFMLKPVPGLSDEDAIKDVHDGIDFLHKMANIYKLDVNMHLNPTYVAKGTILEEEFLKQTYFPPTLEMTRQAAVYAKDKNISLFIGLFDEGLAVDGGGFIKDNDEDKRLFGLLSQFNETQNYSLLQ